MKEEITIDHHRHLQFCPSPEELQARIEGSKNAVNCIINVIIASIETSSKIVIPESAFESISVFSEVINAIGRHFASVEHIEVMYAKPEDKNPKSPTYKEVFPQLIIKNKNVISEIEDLKAQLSSSKDTINKLNATVKRMVAQS